MPVWVPKYRSPAVVRPLIPPCINRSHTDLGHNRLASVRSSSSSLKGPHIRTNFPDPCILSQEGISYAFATNNRKASPELVHVQVAKSSDNETWTVLHGHDAMPLTASWETGGAVWAPDVKQLPDGTFLLYYTDSLKTNPSTHCIGAATSKHVLGPYRPLQNPLVCPSTGAIDPAGFFDRTTGKRYIIYKIDGNSLGNGGSCSNDVFPIISTPLMLQEVDAYDGISLIGRPIQILDREARDGPLIEAPAMFLSSGGIYFLFYSANCFTTPLYHTSYATATNIRGPYTRAARPLFMSGEGLDTEGPGGLDIIHNSYATTDTTFYGSKQRRDKHMVESRMIVFHGRMNPYNDETMRQIASGSRDGLQKPIKDLHLPFVRGMYSGTAYFKGRTATISKGAGM